MITTIIVIINWLARILILLLFLQVIFFYVLKPNNIIRLILDAIFLPLLIPIQRHIPIIAGIDFSPILLAVIIEFIRIILVNLLQLLV
jgi:uncharacterized protein YggT (Ycf19 family)